MHLNITDCTDADFEAIAPELRTEDKNEWLLFSGHQPLELYRSGWRLPRGTGCINRIGRHDETGEMLAMWGVNPIGGRYSINYPKQNTGWVWLAATPAAYRVVREMHRHLWDEFERMQGFYDFFYTQSWDGNPLHHKWLEWMGFAPCGGMRLENGADFSAFSYRVTPKE